MNLSRKLLLAMALLAAVMAIGTAGYRILVGGGWLDSLYMTVITLSTVGYGEVVPGLEASPAGRGFTMLLILAGMGILLYAVSVTTAFFVEGELTNLLRRRKMDNAIAKLDGHTLLCGIGSTGVHVADELTKVGRPFVILEANEASMQRALASHPELLYLIGDATEEAVLQRAGIERAQGLVSALSNDKDNLFVTFTARQLNPRLRIVARAVDPAIHDRMARAGADAIVSPNHIGGLRIASELLRPHVVGFLDRMLRRHDATWRFEEVAIPAGSRAAGQPLHSLRIEDEVGIPVLAVSAADGHELTYYPQPETVLAPNARLVVLTDRRRLEKLRALVAT